MKPLSSKRLKDYIKQHAAAESALRAWWQVVQAAEWHDFTDVRKTFNSADYVDPVVVFNIGGNKYRLVAYVDYERQQVVLKWFGTHAAYNKGEWKWRVQ